MCKQARNMEKFGVPNPDRKERHAVCKKQMSDESDNSSTDDNSYKENTSDENGNVCMKCFGFV